MRGTVTSTPGTLVAWHGGSQPRPDAAFEARSYLLKQRTASASIYLSTSGTADATSSTGFEWAITDPAIDVSLEPGAVLYASCAGTVSQVVDILESGAP